MIRRTIAAVGRAIARPNASETPHFHQGAQGNAAACFTHGCDRPQLRV
jgi:hypothetical protein